MKRKKINMIKENMFKTQNSFDLIKGYFTVIRISIIKIF